MKQIPGRTSVISRAVLLLGVVITVFLLFQYFNTTNITDKQDCGLQLRQEIVHPTQNEAKPRRYYGQFEEDKMLNDRIFKDKKNGVFVELGGYDGLTYSNSLFFEESLGWTGVLFEPVPKSFGFLKKNRPYTQKFNMAICEQEKFVDMIFGEAHTERATAGVADKIKDNLDFMKKFHTNSRTEKLFCGPIGKYLKLSGIDHIDLFSIDVEGSEYEVLLTMDWSIPVHVVIVETNKAPENIQAVLKEKGFQFFTAHKGGSEVWINHKYSFE